MGKSLKIAIIILLTLVILYSIFVYRNKTQLLENSVEFKNEKVVEKKEPVPFEEITIPYLRTKKYVSELGELRKVSENSSYTSYLTSYNSEGFKINALLTEPKGIKPAEGWPAIVFIHGYIPPKQYQTLQNYSSHVDSLARNGFVIFKIDLRGHGTSEGEAGGGYYGSDYVIDTLNAYTALQNTDFIDKNKIGLWGHSMAGNIVVRSVAAKQTIPAAVIWAGAVYTYQDFRDYGIQDNSYQAPNENSPSRIKRNQLFETHGQFDANNNFWKQVAPTNYLDGVKTAVQINHAINDDVVKIDYSRNLMSILDKTSIKHELKEYQSGGHNITGSSYNQAMQNTIDFFKQNLFVE